VRQRDERGSASLELLLLGSGVLLLGYLVIGGARLPTAMAETYNDAAAAARTAALARTPAEAATAGRQAVVERLGARCASFSIVVDTSAFAATKSALGLPVPGRVVVDVRCEYDLRQAFPATPLGTTVFHARSVETVDPYRGQ
jgi:hypothetical protein